MSNSEEKIALVGIGGGGCHSLDCIYKNTEFKDSFKFISINTDIQCLNCYVVPNKIQIGKSVTNGLGCGCKKVVLISCLGGGTGTGATPVIAKFAKELGLKTISVISKPFYFEGKRRMAQAVYGLEVLEEYTDEKEIINTQDILDNFSEKTSLSEAFSVLSEKIYERVKLLLML